MGFPRGHVSVYDTLFACFFFLLRFSVAFRVWYAGEDDTLRRVRAFINIIRR